MAEEQNPNSNVVVGNADALPGNTPVKMVEPVEEQMVYAGGSAEFDESAGGQTNPNVSTAAPSPRMPHLAPPDWQ